MNIINYEELDSTQLEAKRLVEKNSASDGTIIVAKNQINGIGTHEELMNINEIYKEVYTSQRKGDDE